MKPIIKMLAIIALLALVSGSFAAETYTSAKHAGKYPEYPKVNYGTGPQAKLIKHGEYLAKAGDCIACHTNNVEGGKAFAGGLPIHTPFGTIYSPNITPDKQTGIGNWTDQQFINAVRKGIAPDGSYYFPVFPYTYYAKLSDDDVRAIHAYLKAIPAVNQPNRPVDMPIPFRWRFLQFFWRLLYFDFKGDAYKADPVKSSEWNRGKFLVEGLGHCGMCHSPLNFLGAEKKEYYLTGGFVEGFYAPNITSTNLRGTPVQQVVDVFLKDKLIGGGDVQGPMLEVNHDSLKYLNVEDLESICVYLQTVKSKEPPKPKSATKIDLKVGEQIYNKYCTGCHSSGAGGAPKFGVKADWTPLVAAGLNNLYQNAMNGISGMPPKGNCSSCTLIDIQSAVNYILSQSGGAPGVAAGAMPSLQVESPTSLAKGKEIYDKVCSVCHNKGQLGAPKLGDKAVWGPIIAQKDMDVLFTHSIDGYKDMPPKGSCEQCSDADIIAAVKYMVQQSAPSGNYELW